jgi:hypothetical protein
MPTDPPSALDTLRLLQARVADLERERQRRRRFTWAIAGVTLVSLTAFGQLVTFTPDTPARADEVNGNFAQLRSWLEQKVGPVGTSTLTLTTPLAGSMVADGSLTGGKIQDNTIASADVADGTIANVDLDLDLRCPTGARQSFGQCIFYLPTSGPAYVYTFREAAAACLGARARLCTVAEVSAAQAAGMENCAFGWLADRTDNNTAIIGFPMQTVLPGCGGSGVNTAVTPMVARYGTYCCK